MQIVQIQAKVRTAQLWAGKGFRNAQPGLPPNEKCGERAAAVQMHVCLRVYYSD